MLEPYEGKLSRTVLRGLETGNGLRLLGVFCGDAEKEMKNAMTKDDELYQLDLVHAARITGFKLWEDKIMSLEERKTIVIKLEGVLYTLKNAVEKHLVDKNTDA
jgi:hypothetical protein